MVILQMSHARIAKAGEVMRHTRTMFPPTPQRNAANCADKPTPIMVEEIIWVVDSGCENYDADKKGNSITHVLEQWLQ